VGRESESAALIELLRRRDVRLVTLTGAPGTGKTRLALEVARSLAGAYEDGVVLVSLGSLGDARLVMPTVRAALGLGENGQRPAVEVVAEHCFRSRLLLVLDNFEHLLGAGSDLAHLMAACPNLSVLATSRAPLRIRDEYELALAPLELPGTDRDEAADPAALANVASIQLFVERAQAVEAGFRLTAENAAAIAAICRRLDGLPLALELAAPCLRLLQPHEMLRRLDRRLDLLVDGPRDLPERQRTMRAALDWSCELLDEEARALLRRLSVFAGGASLAGMERVCQAAGPLSDGVLRHLMALVEHGLVQRQEAAGELRVTMLESVREYGRGQLAAAGELEATARAHLEHCVDLAELTGSGPGSPGTTSWLDRLRREQDNLWAALGWATECRDAEMGLRLAGALWFFWDASDHRMEGLRWLDELLASGAPALAATRAEALFASGFLAWRLGVDQLAVSRLPASLSTFQDLGDRYAAASVLHLMGLVAGSQGSYPHAISLLERTAELLRDVDDPSLLARTLANMGACLSCRGDAEGARSLVEEALVLWPGLGAGLEALDGEPYLVRRAMTERNLDLARALLDAQAVVEANSP
jgi:predicted ATPase